MIDGSVLQSAQRCFEKKSRVVVKMVVTLICPKSFSSEIKKILSYGRKVKGKFVKMCFLLKVFDRIFFNLILSSLLESKAVSKI